MANGLAFLVVGVGGAALCVLRKAEEGIIVPADRITSGLGTGNLTWVLWKSSKHP